MFIEIRVYIPKYVNKDFATELGEYLKDLILDDQEEVQPVQVVDVTYELKEDDKSQNG